MTIKSSIINCPEVHVSEYDWIYLESCRINDAVDVEMQLQVPCCYIYNRNEMTIMRLGLLIHHIARGHL